MRNDEDKNERAEYQRIKGGCDVFSLTWYGNWQNRNSGNGYQTERVEREELVRVKPARYVGRELKPHVSISAHMAEKKKPVCVSGSGKCDIGHRWTSRMNLNLQPLEKSVITAALSLPCEKRMDLHTEKDHVVLVVNERKAIPGIVGMENLGNTCYFNSGMQCLIHTRRLMKYFLYEWSKMDMKSEDATEMKVVIADAFRALAVNAWSGRATSVSPSELNSSLWSHPTLFSQDSQHDVHELVLFVLDSLHQELNRCREKKAIRNEGRQLFDDDTEIAADSWQRYLVNNDSVIVDIFQGQLRSTISCSKCDTRNVAFDPYVCLSLPIPPANIRVLFIPFNLLDAACVIEVTSGRSVEEAVSLSVGRSVRVTVVSKRKGSCFTSLYMVGISSNADVMYALEIPDHVDRYVIGVVVSWSRDISRPVIARISNWDISFKDVAKDVEKRLGQILWNGKERPLEPRIHDENSEWVSHEGERIKWDEGERVQVDPGHAGAQLNRITPEIAGSHVMFIHVNPRYVNKEYAAGLRRMSDIHRKTSLPPASHTLRLSQCFQYLSVSDTLDGDNKWRCPTCCEFVRANKTIDVWSVGSILAIHLERFVHDTHGHPRKCSRPIDFPDELDISPYITGTTDDSPVMYKLYSVSAHTGGLSGGHYQTYSLVSDKTQNTQGCVWYLFDDTRVKIVSRDEVHKSGAYLLFYERAM